MKGPAQDTKSVQREQPEHPMQCEGRWWLRSHSSYREGHQGLGDKKNTVCLQYPH